MSEPLDLSQVNFPDVMNIRMASIFLNLSEARIRALIRSEEISATMVDKKWTMSIKDLTVFRDTPRIRKTSGPRGDGKLWVIRVPHGKLEAVKAMLAKEDIELAPRYNYEKQKAYQVKRKAALQEKALANAEKSATPASAASVTGKAKKGRFGK